jgi:hypothetical protein
MEFEKGVNLMKSKYELMQEIAEAFHDLTDVDKSFLAGFVAARRGVSAEAQPKKKRSKKE